MTVHTNTAIQKILTKYQESSHTVKKERRALKIAKAERAAAIRSQKLVQQVAQSVQEEAHKQIATVVSRCLESVFDEPYTFKIEFERKRGRTEARLVLERDGKTYTDPLNETGGGVADVAAFAARLAALMLTKPRLRRLLVLDEPFRYVSADYRDRVRALLETLTEEMGVQIVMVTHSEQLMAGKVIELP